MAEKLPCHDTSSDEDSSDDDVSNELLRQLLQLKIGADKSNTDQEDLPKVLEELSVDGIVKYIKAGKATKIITMAGAGISTSAGIPDFRSPGTGLYDNLEEYNLPSPQSVFDIEYFKEHPEPFFKLAKSLWPKDKKFQPTVCHRFIKLLHVKGLLLRHYTQNIDSLERSAGLPEELLIEAHGTFHTSHCTSCSKTYSQEFIEGEMAKDSIPTCTDCNHVVKPDIVFFGENLPSKFFTHVQSDFEHCNLLIIMGTSLTVQPFARLIDRVPKTCPRLLINLEKVGVSSGSGLDFLSRILSGVQSGGLDFDSEKAYRDVAILGTCDEGCESLANALGWKDDMDKLSTEGTTRPESGPEENSTNKL